MNEAHIQKIAGELKVSPRQVLATAKLFAEGATVPFIARYRKEATGSLDEVAVTNIRERLLSLAELDQRRESILKSLAERNLLTDQLKADIAAAVTKLSADILHKDPNVTAVIVQSVDPADWFAGGRSLAEQKLASVWVDIHISDGTNSKDEKADFIAATFQRMDDLLGPEPRLAHAVTAAGFAIAYGTAHGALRWRAELHVGEVLLVHGAGSGVGLTAVECGKAIGATVIATARGADKLAVAREHGADHVLDSEDAGLRDQIRALTDGRGADVVYDPVGGTLFDISLRAIAWEGRIVIVGFASGTVPQIPANHLLVKNASVLGFYWGSYRKHDPERLREGFAELFDWLAAGRIRPHVSTTLPLAETGQAIRLLAERRSVGKVVVTCP